MLLLVMQVTDSEEEVVEMAAEGVGHELELMQEKGEFSKARLLCHSKI